ncbi:unnamed protein product [Closterium sp. Naga37s-1]|nr:unnamed protein product [Closterium sp. Naga37s-1]
MKSATASYPNSVVGPYEWTYFPAEVPESALIVRFEFRKLWASQAVSCVPRRGTRRLQAQQAARTQRGSHSKQAAAAARRQEQRQRHRVVPWCASRWALCRCRRTTSHNVRAACPSAHLPSAPPHTSPLPLRTPPLCPSAHLPSAPPHTSPLPLRTPALCPSAHLPSAPPHTCPLPPAARRLPLASCYRFLSLQLPLHSPHATTRSLDQPAGTHCPLRCIPLCPFPPGAIPSFLPLTRFRKTILHLPSRSPSPFPQSPCVILTKTFVTFWMPRLPHESLEAAAKAAGGSLSPFGRAMGAPPSRPGEPVRRGQAGRRQGVGNGVWMHASYVVPSHVPSHVPWSVCVVCLLCTTLPFATHLHLLNLHHPSQPSITLIPLSAHPSHLSHLHLPHPSRPTCPQQPVAGVWNVGVFSEWGPARTQSKMVLRGAIPPIDFSPPPPTSQTPPTPSPLSSHVLAATSGGRVERGGVQRVGPSAHAVQDGAAGHGAHLRSRPHRLLLLQRAPPLRPLLQRLAHPAAPPPALLPHVSSSSPSSPGMDALYGGSLTHQCLRASSAPLLFTLAIPQPLPKLLISIYPEPPSSSSASSTSPLPSWLTGHARSANSSLSVQLRRMALLGPSNRGAPAGPSFSVQLPSETEEQAGSSNSGVRGSREQEGRGGAEGGAGVDVWWSEGRMDIGSWQSVADPGSWHLLLSHPASSAARSGPGNGSTVSNSSSIGVNGSTSVGSVGSGSSGGREGGDGGWLASLWGGSWTHGQQGGAADEGEGGGEVCVSIQWKAATCFPRLTGPQCQWPLIPLEPHLLSWTYESGLDAAYLPPASPAPPSLWASWFPVPLAASPSPARPSWAFLSLAPPFGARGGVLSIHLRLLPLRRGDGAQGDGEGQGGEGESGGSGNNSGNSSAAGVAAGSSGAAPRAFVYLLVRAGGLPSLTRFDASAVAPATDMAARGGQLSLELIHPAEVTTFVAVGLDAAPSRGGGEGGEEEGEGAEAGEGEWEWEWEWEVRVVQHGCPNGCSGSPCHVMADGAFQFGVYYCFCDRSNGGVDCSIETVSQLGIEQQRWALVGSNVVAVLPAMVSLYLGAYPEWVMFSLNGLCSALYHLCDTDGWCAARYPTLQFADFYSCFLAVLLAFLHAAQVPIWPRFLFFVVASFSTAVMAVDRATSGWSIVVLLALGAAALVTGWFIRLAALRRSAAASSSAAPHAPHTPLEAASCAVQCVEEQGGSRHGHVEEEGASLLPPPCSSDGEWPCGAARASKAQQHASVWRRMFHWCRAQGAVVLRMVLALLATFHVPSLLGGALAALLGGSSFLVEVPSTYWIWHSVWHVCMYSAAFFFMLASPPPNKHGSLPLALSPRSPPPKQHDSFCSHRNSDDVSVAGSSSGDGSSEGGWPMGKRVGGCSVGREVEVDEERGLLLIRDHS